MNRRTVTFDAEEMEDIFLDLEVALGGLEYERDIDNGRDAMARLRAVVGGQPLEDGPVRATGVPTEPTPDPPGFPKPGVPTMDLKEHR